MLTAACMGLCKALPAFQYLTHMGGILAQNIQLIAHKNMLHLEIDPNQKQMQTFQVYKQSLILQWAISNFVMS